MADETPSLEVILDRIERRMGRIEEKQKETHGRLEKLADHYDNTRRKGPTEWLESLRPRSIILLVTTVAGLFGGGTHILNQLNDEPVANPVYIQQPAPPPSTATPTEFERAVREEQQRQGDR